jgi:hypothetical protein
MSTTTADPRLEIRAAEVSAVDTKRTPAIKVWATVGALMLLFEAYVYIRWITGPFFKRVPAGPTPLPGWMKAELVGWEVVMAPIAAGVLYWLVVRPWRRDRRVGINGVIVLAGIGMFFMDPIGNWSHTWFTYNTYMVNMGSWVNSVPGAANLARPGQMVAEPLLYIVPTYLSFYVAVAALGAFVMRRVHGRWPRASSPVLIAVCFGGMLIFDVLIEGLVWLPMGLWEYPGAHWALFGANTYHPYPLEEGFLGAALMTGVACLRYFVNDRGETLAERGLSELRGSAARKLGIRVLAVIAAMNTVLLCSYVIPGVLLSVKQPTWPKDLQRRSYLTDYVCGAGTGRVCPGPGVPVPVQGGAYLGPGGKLVVPKGLRLPGVIPFETK